MIKAEAEKVHILEYKDSRSKYTAMCHGLTVYRAEHVCLTAVGAFRISSFKYDAIFSPVVPLAAWEHFDGWAQQCEDCWLRSGSCGISFCKRNDSTGEAKRTQELVCATGRCKCENSRVRRTFRPKLLGQTTALEFSTLLLHRHVYTVTICTQGTKQQQIMLWQLVSMCPF